MQFAQLHCNKGKYGCSWYHGSWHLLKSLGLVSTSAVHEQTITKLLKLALTDISSPRILLTGSTDETLVRLVHNTCATLGNKGEIHAVDLCATPLAFMQAYADEHGIKLHTYHSDILEFDTENKFDLILTHAFMGYFNDTQRPFLIKKWQQLLSEQGKIITIQRVRPADSPKQVTFDEEQKSRFVSAAMNTARNLAPDSKIPDSELELIKAAATGFAENFSNYAITSRATLESLFTDADLHFNFLEYHHLEQKGELSGPSVPSNAEFAHIIAKKSEVIHDT